MNASNEFVYDPNINVIPGSPDSTTTDLLDGIEELIKGKIENNNLK